MKTEKKRMKSRTIFIAGIAVFVAVWMAVPSAQAKSQIIHDAEYVRMEKHFGEQWKADDAVVRKKLARSEERRVGKECRL